eukprot:scaffold79127_cov62-Cyclotella_meneghiniana.AAC.2
MVGCRVERFVSSSWSHGSRLFSKIRSHLSIRRMPSTGLPVVAYTSQLPSVQSSVVRFDTDSFDIGIDTMCSCTMSSNKDCFQDLVHFSPSVEGVAGSIEARGKGTFCFKLEDETGKLHTIKLPGSLYVPNLKRTLLCPQHWSQLDDSHSTYIKNDKYGCWLVWNHGKSRKFVPLDDKTNTPIFRSAPGSFNYRAFEATYCAMDAAFANRQTVTFDNLLRSRGEHHHDPAEFVANEYFNTPVNKHIQQNEE